MSPCADIVYTDKLSAGLGLIYLSFFYVSAHVLYKREHKRSPVGFRICSVQNKSVHSEHDWPVLFPSTPGLTLIDCLHSHWFLVVCETSWLTLSMFFGCPGEPDNFSSRCIDLKSLGLGGWVGEPKVQKLLRDTSTEHPCKPRQAYISVNECFPWIPSYFNSVRP